jgi:RNA polymerase sigma factor (sigma-70 family)
MSLLPRRRSAAAADLMRTDDDLLHAYATRRDEAAFAEVVERHVRAVYRACLRIARVPQDAEEATQAVFHILARRASSPPDGRLAAWLHGVAWRVAAAQRRERRRRLARETAMADLRNAAAADAARRTDVAGLLDEALSALPAALRQAVVLRYLEGRSQEESAAIAGCPRGTLAWRASAGLERLRRRLLALGCALSTDGLARALEAEAAGPAPHGLAADLVARVARNAPADADVEALVEAYRIGALRRAVGRAALLLAAAALVVWATATHALNGEPGAAPQDAPKFEPTAPFVVDPCPDFAARIVPGEWPSGPAASELRGLRAHAVRAETADGGALVAVADGRVAYVGAFFDPPRTDARRLVVLEHDFASRTGASTWCTLALFPGDVEAAVVAGARVVRGATLGVVRAATTGDVRTRTPFWFAAREGSYLDASPGFRARWAREATNLAREAGLVVEDAARFDFARTGDDGVEISLGGRTIVNVSLLRTCCGPDPNPPPLADWCFDGDDATGWTSPAPWLARMRRE